MRVMAVDFGDTRTGVAFSDLTGSIAGEALVITEKTTAKVAERLAELYASRDAQVLALGCPINMNGTRGPRAEKSEAMAARLREMGLNVELVDERLTTVAAHNIMAAGGVYGKKRRQQIDAVAASLILETYLGKMNSKG